MDNAMELRLEVSTPKAPKLSAGTESDNGYRHLKPLIREEARLIFQTDPYGLGAEQFRVLRRTLSQRCPTGGVLMITSPSQGDGKTLTSLNLCTCLATGGEKTLLVEADIRRPMVRNILGCTVEPPGIEDLLEGTTQPSKAVYFIEELSFHAAVVTKPPDDPARLINRDTLKQLLTWAREHFHWIVLDAAPIFPAADASEWMTLVDGVLLVVRAQSTPRELSRRSIEVLGKSLYGVIFNGVTTESSPYYRCLRQYSAKSDDGYVTPNPTRSVSGSGMVASVAPYLAKHSQASGEVEIRKAIRLKSILGMLLIASLVLLAIGLSWAGWQKIRHTEVAVSASARVMARPSATEKDSRDITLPGAPALKHGGSPQITGIRHVSSENSRRVIVDLEDQVQYEAHALDNPARVYFDLFDTQLAPGLENHKIQVNDAFLKCVRMAQPTKGITRIVLEVKKGAELSVSLGHDPYRLTVEVRPPSINRIALAPATLTRASSATFLQANQNTASSPVPGRSRFLVVLDPAHGGWDWGTLGRRGLVEKDVVLEVVERLGKLLQDRLGADIIYTRQDDSYLPLEKRADIANLAKANLFLSVHANYGDLPTARGVETYYTTTYSSLTRTADFSPSVEAVNWTGIDVRDKLAESLRLATDVQQALYAGLSARTRAIRNGSVKAAQYVVLTGTQVPAALAEMSLVSSPNDENRAQSSEYRQQIAEALYNGIARFHSEVEHTNLASNQRLSR